jgi:hypothetical protein
MFVGEQPRLLRLEDVRGEDVPSMLHRTNLTSSCRERIKLWIQWPGVSRDQSGDGSGTSRLTNLWCSKLNEVRPVWSVLVPSYDQLSSQQQSTDHAGSENRVAFPTKSANVSCMDTLQWKGRMEARSSTHVTTASPPT